MVDVAEPTPLFALLRLPASLPMTSGCLNRQVTARIGGIEGTISSPSIEWGQGGRPRLIGPTVSETARKRIEWDDDPDVWGVINHWNPDVRTAYSTEVGALLFSFQTDQVLNYSQYLYGKGHPQGQVLNAIYEAFGDWFDSLRTWLEVKTTVDLDPGNPPDLVELPGSGVSIWSEVDGVTSLPASHNVIHLRRDNSREKHQVTLPVFRTALHLVEVGTLPSHAHILLRDGRAAMRRNQLRRAVIDAGAAVESTLKGLAANKAISIGSSATLGSLVNHGKLRGHVVFPARIQTVLVDLRNNAIHHAVIPTRQQAERALGIARRVVLNVEPLPL